MLWFCIHTTVSQFFRALDFLYVRPMHDCNGISYHMEHHWCKNPRSCFNAWSSHNIFWIIYIFELFHYLMPECMRPNDGFVWTSAIQSSSYFVFWKMRQAYLDINGSPVSTMSVISTSFPCLSRSIGGIEAFMTWHTTIMMPVPKSFYISPVLNNICLY